MDASFQQQYMFTFEGCQGWNVFSIQVVAFSEQEARQSGLDCVSATVRRTLFKKMTQCYLSKDWASFNQVQEELAKLPNPSITAHPIDDFLGCQCDPITNFFNPIFVNPKDSDSHKSIGFEQWIALAPVKISKFNPHTIRVYSCLDG